MDKIRSIGLSFLVAVPNRRLHVAPCRPVVERIRCRKESVISDSYQLIYSSRPFGYDQATLDGILLDARRCNTRDQITGALVCRQDVYVQMLEGNREKVSASYDRIRRDDRHLEVKLRFFGDASERLFGKWAMLHDPAKSWLWSRAEISGGILDRAGVSDFKRLFQVLANNVNSDGSPSY
ncbi:MAG: BLUF domain-containing protein [Pseudomonadota bacterium]